jgi:cardiolipin synthase A/B
MTESSSDIKETVFSDGSQYFTSLLQDIAAALTSIDLETYIFDLDSIGLRVVDQLLAAARRGVRVRLMLDGAGSSGWNSSTTEQLKQAGAQVRIFRPLPWNIRQWDWTLPQPSWLVQLQHLLASISRRNHRKICLIDGRLAWVGSFNISKYHLPKAQGGQGWRDTAVRLEGFNLDELQHAFDSAWFDDPAKVSRRIFSISNFRLNHIRRRILRRDLLTRISRCQSRIWITNAYFMPDAFFLSHLKKAARRGIDVRILLPGASDIFFMPWASALYYQPLLKAQVRIFEYTGSMLHAKIMILDDWMTVGSSNLDYRSFFQNLEVDIVLTLTSSRTTIQEQFLDDINHSQEIFLKDLPYRPWWKRLIGRLLLYVRRWL